MQNGKPLHRYRCTHALFNYEIITTHNPAGMIAFIKLMNDSGCSSCACINQNEGLSEMGIRARGEFGGEELQ